MSAEAPPPPPSNRRFTARDAIRVVLVAAALLVVIAGDGVSRAAERMDEGIIRSVVSAVGKPTGWIADRLPFSSAADQVAGWVSPDDEDTTLAAGGAGRQASGGATTRVPPEAFTPEQLGERAERAPLRTLLVTGDSMVQPLDAVLARRLADAGVRTERDPHLGTGLSKTFLLDWPTLAREQATEVEPDAVLVFLGANEGFPMEAPGGEVECCGPAWAAEYATRARSMMDAYTRGGAREVLWVLLPAPRDPERAKITRAVNAAVRVAAGGLGAQVRLVDAERLFTPGGRFRSAMPVDGREQIVREPDGIHLNEEGAELLARGILPQLAARYELAAS